MRYAGADSDVRNSSLLISQYLRATVSTLEGRANSCVSPAAMTPPVKRKNARRGRPPVGTGGQKVSEYPQVMIRLPRETKVTLDALSGLTGTPIWRLVDQAIEHYVQHMPESQRRLLVGVRERRAREKKNNGV